MPRIEYDVSSLGPKSTFTRAESDGIGRPAASAAARITGSRSAYTVGEVELE